MNTDSIGVSIACMGGAVESPFNAGKWPMKVEQLHSLIAGVAKLSKAYGIEVTAKTILSHADVQGTLGVTQRNKWDYTVLPFDSKVKGAKAIGDYIRYSEAQAMEAAWQRRELARLMKIVEAP